MKINKLVIAVGVGLVMASGSALALPGADSGHGTVTFTGTIIDAPCSIAPDSIDQTVSLGQISNKVLEGGGKSTPVPFQIKLEDCNVESLTDKTVTTTFDGTPAGSATDLFAIAGTASGAGVAVTANDGVPVTLGEAASTTGIMSGDNELNFAAYLTALDASSAIVPGDFTSVANFTLAYN